MPDPSVGFGIQEIDTLGIEKEAVKRASRFTLITLVAVVASIIDLTFGTGLSGISISAIAIGLDALGVYFLWTGFRKLSKVDPGNFSLAARLILVLLIALPLILLGLVLPFQSDDPARILAGLSALGIGGLLALVGLFGEVLGLWRIGQRYNDMRIKLGSLFFFIPFVGIIGTVLLILGVRNVASSLGAKGRAPAP